MTLLGELSLWIAVVMGAWTIALSWAGAAQRRADFVRSGERALCATFLFTALACVGVCNALVAHDYSYKFVASFSSTNLPRAYTLAALWAGPAGLLLLWTLLLTACSTLFVFANRRANRATIPWATATLGALALFLLLGVCLGANPFARLDWSPGDGIGLNPLLQDAGMLVQPPTLVLGYAATAVPFAISMAALLSRTFGTRWQIALRQSVLVAWFVLTAALALGMWWAYASPDTTQTFIRDAVASPSLLPWIACGACIIVSSMSFTHNAWRTATVTLAALPFPLSTLASVMARDGIIHSVQSFAGTQVQTWLLGLLAVLTGGAAYLLSTRLSELAPSSDREFVAVPSVTTAHDRAVRLGIYVAILWGTLLPLLTESIAGHGNRGASEFFGSMHGSLGLLLLFVTCLAPGIAWRNARGVSVRQLAVAVAAAVVLCATAYARDVRDFHLLVASVFAGLVVGAVAQDLFASVRQRSRDFDEAAPLATVRHLRLNRRRYGGHLASAAMAALVSAFAGQAYRHDIAATIATGESVQHVDASGDTWQLTSQGLSRFEERTHNAEATTVAVSRNGRRLGLLSSEKRQYTDDDGTAVFDATTSPGLLSSFREDVYLVFESTSAPGTASVRVWFNPLVRWIWYGSALLACGVLLLAWPSAEARSVRGGLTEAKTRDTTRDAQSPGVQ